jgi:aspartyl protease family protein
MGLDADSLMRVVYLGLLLAFVAGFFLVGRRHRLGRSVRDFAIWVLIFAMVVIAYGFRDVLREELLPSAMVSRSNGSIELRRGSDGHFHIEALVNGVAVRFLVDTGASDLVLSLADAAHIGIDPADLAFVGRARTANGVVATAPVRLDRVEVAGFSDSGVPASVGGGELDVSLLGMSYLDRFATIEIAGDRMTLRR